MRFLKFYNYRLTRKYDGDVTPEKPIMKARNSDCRTKCRGKGHCGSHHRNDLIVNSGLLEKSARNAVYHVGGRNSRRL
jgi:hypothetical protein